MSGLLRKKCWIVLLLLAGYTYPVLAQSVQFRSTSYTTENSGLSHNTVLNVFQDSRGFLWVGTMDGLNRFDGQKFNVFRHNPADSTSISDNFIHGIFERSDGMLWVGTRDGGFNIINPYTNAVTRINSQEGEPNGVPNRPSNLIFEDSHGFFWIGFFSSSVGTFDDASNRFIPAKLTLEVTGEPIQSVNHILELNNGSFLISSRVGLFYLAASEVDRFRTNPTNHAPLQLKRVIFAQNYPAPETNLLYVDNDGALWGELVGNGLKKTEPGLFPEEVVQSLLTGTKKSSSPNSIIERDSFLIFGAGGGVLHQIDKATERTTAIRVTSEEFNGSTRVYQDLDGNIWCATWGGGLFLLEERKGIELFSTDLGLSSNFILAFADDEHGTWVGSSAGLDFLTHDGDIIPYDSITGFENQSIWSLWRDEYGLWISTRFGGLYFIPQEQLTSGNLSATHFNPQNSLILSNDVHQVITDSRGWLWLGYQGEGVQIIKNVAQWLEGAPAELQNFSRESPEPSINSNSVRKMYEDEDGNIWIATTDNGFNYLRFDNNELLTIQKFEHRPNTSFSLSHPDGRSVLQQNDSTFWFASYGGGITRWRTTSNELRNFRTNDGLANNSVYGILPDKNTRFIWASTNNGLSRLDTESLRFTNFTTADGLQNNEFNTGAYLANAKGHLFFGGVGGFNQINTEVLSIDTTIPPVYISEINVFNTPLMTDSSALYTNNLVLPYSDNFLSFEFSALDLSQPQYVQFAYKMDGVDNDWVYSGSRNFAEYPNLEPGNYSLQVKAANSDGFWNETGTTLSLTITPPWWQTLWFRLLSTGLMLGTFILIIRYFAQRTLKEQIRKMEMEQKLRNERERISRDLHDHVGSQLANIMSGLSLVDKYNEFDEKEKSTEMMRSLKGDAEVTIKQLRETIWALNQNELTISEFTDHLRGYFKNQSALTAVLKVEISVASATNKDTNLNSTQALNVFRIIQEASQNTLKYAEAEHLTITMHEENNFLLVGIKDDGNFKTNSGAFNSGYGLNNMKKRAREINASVHLNTDSGTEIVLRVPLQ